MRDASQTLILLFALSMVMLSACLSGASSMPLEASTATTTRPAEIVSPSPGAARPTETAMPRTPTPPPTRTRLQRQEGAPPVGAAPGPTVAPLPTATLVSCSERMPQDEDLLVPVTRDFGLSRSYEPGDLVPLGDYFTNHVTLGYPTAVREAIIGPLQRLIQAMQDEGLAPQIVSGYRSYSAQSIALQKWLEQYPDWAHNLSAPPGHSEHQLGTTVDFGSPELETMLGEDYVQFHPAFAQTSEGRWLAQHAPEYGFTMSYPQDAFERTTFYYEPWHFRYVGEELARTLASEELTISEHLETEQPTPCLAE